MRVLALNYEFPPLGGGAGNATAHISRELVELGCTVSVLTTWFPGTDRHEIRDGYAVHRVRALRRRVDRSSPLEMASFVASAALPALRLARRVKPDIVHVYFALPTGLLGLLIKRFTGTPYLLSLRGGDVPGFLPETLGGLHRLTAPLHGPIWHGAAGIIANSEGLRDLAQEQMGLPVELAPNGVDLREYCPSSAPVEGPLRALFTGRLVRQKRVPFLLEAVRDLPVSVDLVGAGPDEEALREQAVALGIQDRVRFLGWASREEMPQRYRDADVFVFPSVEEGMPNVVLEAMASGLPIIATDIYGHRGLVKDGDNGFLVPVEDSKAIAGALRRLAADPKLRQQMGERSRKRAEAFGWRRTAETYLRLSERALA